MSEPVVIAKVTCRADGTSINVRWDEDTVWPVPCPVCGGPTVARLREHGTWVEVSVDQSMSESQPAEEQP